MIDQRRCISIFDITDDDLSALGHLPTEPRSRSRERSPAAALPVEPPERKGPDPELLLVEIGRSKLQLSLKERELLEGLAVRINSDCGPRISDEEIEGLQRILKRRRKQAP